MTKRISKVAVAKAIDYTLILKGHDSIMAGKRDWSTLLQQLVDNNVRRETLREPEFLNNIPGWKSGLSFAQAKNDKAFSKNKVFLAVNSFLFQVNTKTTGTETGPTGKLTKGLIVIKPVTKKPPKKRGTTPPAGDQTGLNTASFGELITRAIDLASKLNKKGALDALESASLLLATLKLQIK